MPPSSRTGALFAHVEHGIEEVGIPDGDRRLFWARLKIRELDRNVLVATAHLTSQRNKVECETGLSPRVGQIRHIIKAMKRLNQDTMARDVVALTDCGKKWLALLSST